MLFAVMTIICFLRKIYKILLFGEFLINCFGLRVKTSIMQAEIIDGSQMLEFHDFLEFLNKSFTFFSEIFCIHLQKLSQNQANQENGTLWKLPWTAIVLK